ncbi:ribonuclease H-like domain-containing protein [Mycena polygramma]|nr:ribonuclease H-like domain-containing protein [Mycena polygramma]
MAAPTDEQLVKLKKASETFLAEEHYGQMQVEPIMEEVFGCDYSIRLANPIACEWATYWHALGRYCEEYKEYLSKALGNEEEIPPVKPAMPGTGNEAEPTRDKSSLTLKLNVKKRKGTETVDQDTRPTKGRRLGADVLTHAVRCDYILEQNPTARKEAEDAQAKAALGAEEKDADAQESAPSEQRPVGRPKKIGEIEKGQSALDLRSFRDAGKKRTKEENEAFQNKANHLLLMLICKCGLVPNLLDSTDWEAFVNHLNPAYVVQGSKKFAKEYIPQEAALVKQRTKRALQKSRDLTYTTDGTSTRRGDQFYTHHACTPTREVYFLGGHFGTKESHNAEWIKTGVIKKMAEIGTELWGAIESDSTNVTLAARRGVATDVPTVLDLCDVVHFVQHVIGDINELPEYEGMMHILKPLIRHFSKSGKSKAYLRDSGEGMADDGGNKPVHMLAKIGKTRFATHFMAVTTVSPVVHNIQRLVLDDKIKFKSPLLQDVFGNRFSVKLPTFSKDMLSYETIVAPLARSLWSLEATTANPSDAFVFWLAIAHTLDSVFVKNEKDTGISAKLAGHVRAIFNSRYHQFFSHNDVYFVAFCLDPRYPNTDFLRERTDSRPAGVPDYITYPHAFVRVKELLKSILKALVEQHASHKSDCLCHPLLKTMSPPDLANALRVQLEAFWLGEAPFHAPVLNDDTMEWWTNLERGNSCRSNVIAMLGVRIFGILVNSMPDERTNSNITWFNDPLRANQGQEGLLDMIMIGQWHRYHAPDAEGPRRPPRRPTVAFRRLDQDVIDRTKLRQREEDPDASESEAESESTEINEEDDEELGKLSDALRLKIARMKRGRKKNKTKTFRSDNVFVVDVDVNLRAYGLKGLLSDTDDKLVAKDTDRAQPQSEAESQEVNWDW